MDRQDARETRLARTALLLHGPKVELEAATVRIVITRRAALDVPDGINISVFSLAQRFIELGHQVFVVGNCGANASVIMDLYGMADRPELVGLAKDACANSDYARVGLLWAQSGRRLIRTLQPDLVILNGALPFGFAAPSCTVAHDLEKAATRLGIMRVAYKKLAYRKSTHLVATCVELKWGLSAQLGIPHERIHIIPPCVNLSRYQRARVEKRVNAVLHLGTIDYKNPASTIAAFGRLSRDCRLFITGRPNETVNRALAAITPAARDRVELLGFVSAERLRELLANVKVVSVPSEYFAPVASPSVIEAFASGTPVVGSESISRDLLRDSENGFVCGSVDAPGMAERFERLLDDTQLWAKLAGNARETSQRFSAETVANAYLELAA